MASSISRGRHAPQPDALSGKVPQRRAPTRADWTDPLERFLPDIGDPPLAFALAAELSKVVARALGSDIAYVGLFDDENPGSRGAGSFERGVRIDIPRTARLRNLIEELTLPMPAACTRYGVYSGRKHRQLQRAGLRIAISWLTEKGLLREGV